VNTGIIFDIKKYAIHDGPGIRTTVFFKGCPLHCLWCHNPESISPEPELSYYQSRCTACYTCVDSCPENAISKAERTIIIDREKCTACGECVQICPSDALEIIGKKVSVNEVIKEIEKDIPFYDESGGGVTFSGGEPLMRADFLKTLLDKCTEMEIHTAVDTSGYVPFGTFEKIMNNVNLFLYDLKLIDNNKHKKYTGVSNSLILKNLIKLDKRGCSITIRIPLIPGINDSDGDIKDFIEFILSLKKTNEINILPYHRGGAAKHKRLGIADHLKITSSLKEEKIEIIKRKFEEKGLTIKIGG